MKAALSAAALFGASGVVSRAAEVGGPASGLRVEHLATVPGSELVVALPLAHNPYRFTTLYSLKLPGLRRGDVVQAHTQFEVTNDLGFNVMLAHAMLVHGRETIVSHSDRPPGGVVCEFAGENITPGMHHGFRTLVGSFGASEDGDAWLSVLIYAASSAAKPGHSVAVEKGYGSLRAILFRR